MQDHVSQIRDNVQQFGLTCTLVEILRGNGRKRSVVIGSSRRYFCYLLEKENFNTDYCNKANLKLSKISQAKFETTSSNLTANTLWGNY